MELKGVDLSFWKGYPDWNNVNSIDFAILGITERGGKDVSFEHNYDGCKRNGIAVGGYKYSYARSGEESRYEAEAIISILNRRPLDFPIFLDLEWDAQANYPKYRLNEIIEEFRKVVEGAGYKFGIYCNKHWYDNIIPAEAKKYDFWIASIPWNDYGQMVDGLKPKVDNLVGWQYSWAGTVPGIGDEIDMDVFYTDFGVVTEVKHEEEEPHFPGVIPPTVEYGETGIWVEILQTDLNVAGANLVVDGIFGDQTYNAVLEFQEDQELGVDGIVGPRTWQALIHATVEDKTVEELAREVACGIWGNQPDREKLLREYGYDNFQDIQNAVNKLV